MKINIHNVGRGSAVLIELPSTDSIKRIGIVDCFWGQSKERLLLRKLEEFNRSGNLSIEFFVITHLHADHFIGAGEIIKKFGSQIKKIYDPGLDTRGVILAEFPTNEAVDTQARKDLRAIQEFKTRFPEKANALSAPDVTIYSDKKNSITVRSVAPNGAMLDELGKVLQTHIQKLKKAVINGELPKNISRASLKNYNLNRTSSAIQICCRKKKIILGGDVLRRSWELILKGGVRLEADAFLLSHHGSSDAFPHRHWKTICRSNGHAIISGYGKGQPASSVLGFLRRSGQIIWITNVPKTSRDKDNLHSYVASIHYGAKNKTLSRQGDVICKISDELQISGPRL